MYLLSLMLDCDIVPNEGCSPAVLLAVLLHVPGITLHSSSYNAVT